MLAFLSSLLSKLFDFIIVLVGDVLNFLVELAEYLGRLLYDVAIEVLQKLYEIAKPLLEPLVDSIKEIVSGPLSTITGSGEWIKFKHLLGYANNYLPIYEFWVLTIAFFGIWSTVIAVRWIIKLIPWIG